MKTERNTTSHIVTLHDDYGDTLTTWCDRTGEASEYLGVTDIWVSRQDYFTVAAKVSCDDCRKSLMKAKS